MNPFIDPSILNDEQLQQQIEKLQARVMSAYAYGMSEDMVSKLSDIYELFVEEQNNRFMLSMQNAWDSQFPDVISTEPAPPKEKEKPARKAAKDKGSNSGGSGGFHRVYKK